MKKKEMKKISRIEIPEQNIIYEVIEQVPETDRYSFEECDLMDGGVMIGWIKILQGGKLYGMVRKIHCSIFYEVI